MNPNILVLAKEPIPGRVKTRLCPPLDALGAAQLAHAALMDTIEVVTHVHGARPMLVVEGRPPDGVGGVDIIEQRGEGLADRIANAFVDAGGSSLLIGMDCPQTTPRQLRSALDLLASEDIDAVIGPALDGGYWAIGLDRPRPEVFVDVPMSVARTCAIQLQRLAEQDLRIGSLPRMRDVDTYADALAVARTAPGSRFARVLRTIKDRVVVAG